MAQANLCRLCVNACNGFKSVYDNNNRRNEVYDITVKYFHPMFLNVEQGNHLTVVICLECWRHILGFYNFQESVLLAQGKLLQNEKQVRFNAISEIVLRPPLEHSVCSNNETVNTTNAICNPKTEITNTANDIIHATSETSNTTSGIFSATYVLKDEEDSISLPDLELIDFYRDIEINSDDDFMPSSCGGVETHTNPNRIELQTKSCNIKAPEPSINDTDLYRTEVSSDAISVSSNESEEFEDPVGIFIGGDFNHTNEKTNTEYETIDLDCSDGEEQSENVLKQPESSGIEANCQANNDCQDIEPDSTTVLTENILESSKETTANDSINAAISNNSTAMQGNDTIMQNDTTDTVSAAQKGRKKRTNSQEVNDLNLDCVICSQSCSSFQSLQGHFQQQHPNEEYFIECCQRKLNDAKQIEEHMRYHNNDTTITPPNKQKRRTPKELDDIIAQWRSSLECPECNVSCSSLTLLREHFRQDHPGKQCYIQCCKQSLKQWRSIEEHIQYHEDPNIFKCELCGKCHKSRLQLVSHLAYRHPYSKDDISQDNPNVLQNTEQSTNVHEVGMIKRRRRTVQESDVSIAQWKPNLECVLCKKNCSSFTLLQEHFQQNHRNVECHILCCERKLKHRYQIEEHIRYHQNPDIFQCKLCGKANKSSVQLYSHTYYQHPATRTVALTESPKQSHNNNAIETNKTEKKRKKSVTEPENSKEQWEKNLECVLCHELCSSHSLLQEHFRQKHPKDECQILKCRFKLTRRNKVEERSSLELAQVETANTSNTSKIRKSSKERSPLDLTQVDTANTSNTSKIRKSSKELDEFIAHYEPNLKCVECSESFPNFMELKYHFRQKHPNRNCHILCCQRRITQRSEIAEHISLHLDPQIFKCEICEKRHVNKNQLLRHIQYLHPTSYNINSLVGGQEHKKIVVRSTYMELDNFIAQHSRQLICALCNVKSAENFTQLEEHFAQTHPSEKCCTLCCERKLKNRCQIEEHLLLHIDANAFKCDECSKHCTSRINLYRHKLSKHPFAKDDGMTWIKKLGSSTKRKTLKDKLLLNTRLKRTRYDNFIAKWKPELECNVCNARCSTFTLLENHVRQRHPAEEFYVLCCQHKWKQRFRIAEHIRLRHSSSLPIIKGKTRSNRRELDDFIAKHKKKLKCEECGNTCPTFRVLREHFRTAHPDEKCYIQCCHRKFSTRALIVDHLRYHEDPDVFKCEICYRPFNSAALRRRHIANCHHKKVLDTSPKEPKPSIKLFRRKSPEERDAFIAQWRSNLECGICSKPFKNYALLDDHFSEEHSNEDCHILCCERTLKSRQQIEEHARYHLDPNTFRCGICKKRHMNKTSLKSHIQYRHRSIITLKDYDFDRNAIKKNFKRPYNNNAKGKSISVPVAHQKSKKPLKNLLIIRKSLEEEAMPSKELIIRKSPEERDAIIAQWRSNLECGICKNPFKNFSLLSDHFSQLHSNEECHILCCERTLKRRHTIEEHARYHLDPNVFKCAKCNKQHMSKHSLICHMNYSKHGCGAIQKSEDRKKMGKMTFRYNAKGKGAKVIVRYQKATEPLKKEINRKSPEERDAIIAQWRSNLECGICSKLFKNFALLDDHFGQLHENEDCHILCCERKLKSRLQIEEHARYHLDPNIFKCAKCNKQYLSKTNLLYHMRYMSHGSATLKNDDPDSDRTGRKKICKRPHHYKANAKVTAQARYQKGKESSLKNLIIIRKTSDELDAIISKWRTNLECGICKEPFTNFSLLGEHFNKEHSNDDCHIVCCERKIKTRQQIEEHARYHLDPIPFKCLKCDKQYTSKASLNSHMHYKHRGAINENKDSDYNRQVKRKRSTKKSKAKAKKTRKEYDDTIAQFMPNLECVVCRETCPTYTLLRTHFQSEHPHDELYIVCCERKFIHRYQVEEHARYHMDPNAFKCKVCDKCHTNRLKLFQHMIFCHPEKRTRYADV